MKPDDYSYFVRRFSDEVAAAEVAQTERARVAHLELALRYSILAARREAGSCPEPRELVTQPEALVLAH
jgi:hypothetical protein